MILDLIKGIAAYEKMSDQVINTEEKIEKVLFEDRKAEVLFALEDGNPDHVIGFALFFENYSTFTGTANLYLEDLFMWPEYRKAGYGRGLFMELVAIARARGCKRMEWVCLNWNQPSIDFYHSLGAYGMREWTTFRLDEKALRLLDESRKQEREKSRDCRILESERLILRPADLQDAEELFALASDPEIGLMAGWKPHPDSDHTRQVIETVLSKPDSWLVTERSTGAVLGCCGINRKDGKEGWYEPGLWLGRPFWKKGYGKEVCRILIEEIASREDVERIGYSHFSDNRPSAALCASLGFVFDALHKDHEAAKLERKVDLLEYRLPEKYWKAGK